MGERHACCFPAGTCGRFRKGRSGNPRGRVLGSRNRATEIAEAMMEGEAAGVTRTLVERARAGNTAAMRLYFERIVPRRRERPVRIAMPEVAGAGRRQRGDGGDHAGRRGGRGVAV
jgi:hypothetical protein